MRIYRVRGLAKNLSPDALRMTLLAQRGEGMPEGMHVDTLDLYAARARSVFIAQAARALGVSEAVVTRDVGAVILALEPVVEAQMATALAPAPPTTPAMSEAEREAALALLRDPHLLERIVQDFECAGVVGEATNTLVGYLAALSRKLPEPLAIIIQSVSAAGKTALMDAILAFVPSEERVQYSAVTGQALFYLAETDLTHKVLAVVEEEGAARASYALKLLQSEGELTIASTGKDPTTGKLVTHAYHVAGPVMIMLTTTAVELDEELVNRALVLTVDESAAQTRAIHRRQRANRTLDGLVARETRRALLVRHQQAQRLVEPVPVVNPYAPQLTFLDARTRTRRDHEKYLTLIDTVALLHQHQRERKTTTRAGRPLTYIEVTRDDIAIANRLAAAVLGRSVDELPPQTRRFLEALDAWVRQRSAAEGAPRRDPRFLAREAREALGTGATQTKLHLRRLVELEYVLVHRAPHGQGVVYELVYTGDAHGGDPAIESGLRDAQSLEGMRREEDGAGDRERSASGDERSGVGRPAVGAWSGDRREDERAPISSGEMDLAIARARTAAHAVNGTGPRDRSHVRP